MRLDRNSERAAMCGGERLVGGQWMTRLGAAAACAVMLWCAVGAGEETPAKVEADLIAVDDDGSLLGRFRSDVEATLWIRRAGEQELEEFARAEAVGPTQGSSPTGWVCYSEASRGAVLSAVYWSRSPQGEIRSFPTWMTDEEGTAWRLSFVRRIVPGAGLAIVWLEAPDVMLFPKGRVGLFDLTEHRLAGVFPPEFSLTTSRVSPLLGPDRDLLLLGDADFTGNTTTVGLWRVDPLTRLDVVEAPGWIDEFAAGADAEEAIACLTWAPFYLRFTVDRDALAMDDAWSASQRETLGMDAAAAAAERGDGLTMLPWTFRFAEGVLCWIDPTARTLALATEEGGIEQEIPLPEGAAWPNLSPAASPNNRWFAWQTGDDEFTLYERTGAKITRQTTVRVQP